MPETKPTILCVDDEVMILKMFEIAFRRDFKILTASSGKEALEILPNNPSIKVLLSDFRMPKMNGAELISKVKEIKPDTSCYILTGFDMTPEIAEALEQKTITRIFRKPVDPETIKSAIQSDPNL